MFGKAKVIIAATAATLIGSACAQDADDAGTEPAADVASEAAVQAQAPEALNPSPAPAETAAPAEVVEAAAPAEETPSVPAAQPAPAAEAPASEPVRVAAVQDAAEPAASASAVPAGDADNGKKVFRQCMACHAVVEGQHRVGPSLYGIVGRTAGTADGFNRYSNANKTSGVTWTEANLFEYLEAPRDYIKGTTMAFAGLKKPQDRADVIAYLKSAAE